MTLTGFEIFNIAYPSAVCSVPEGTCLLAYRGSIAHGMYVPSADPASIDDVDLMGVVLGSERNYLGMQDWGSRGTREVKQGKYDCVYYELKKMVSLLLQGNPNVMSMLWCKDYLSCSPAGRALIDARHIFVGKHVYNAFAGYAHAQMEKMETRNPDELRQYLAATAEAKFRGIHPNHKGEKFPEPERDTGELRDIANYGDERLHSSLAHFIRKGENIGYLGDKRKQLVLKNGYDTKNAAHLVRLLRMCREFMQSGELLVFRSDAAELLDIKAGKWDLSRVKEHAAELFRLCREARDASALPDEPDREAAERLVIGILRDHLGVRNA